MVSMDRLNKKVQAAVENTCLGFSKGSRNPKGAIMSTFSTTSRTAPP